MSVLFVTGTGTDVGKTVATAAVAACASGTVAVVKPAQTGVGPDEPGDLAEVTRLTGITDTFEFARYPEPLSPHHAARMAGLPTVSKAAATQRIQELAAAYDTVIVEGAGGLLVPFDHPDGWTLADLADDVDSRILLVVAAGLGTLNHSALTMRHIRDNCASELAGIVIGSWPAEPDLAMRLNLSDLRRLGPRSSNLLGVLPAGMASMRDFPHQARAALAPELGGTFDVAAFVARY